MIKNITNLAIKCLVTFSIFGTTIHALENGEVVVQDSKQFAWSKKEQKLVSLEVFWQQYIKEQGGLTWKQSKIYPPYNELKEFDLFMVELDSGICLMEFYHSRWRRANDVRRWDDAFNNYSGCSKVFE